MTDVRFGEAAPLPLLELLLRRAAIDLARVLILNVASIAPVYLPCSLKSKQYTVVVSECASVNKR